MSHVVTIKTRFKDLHALQRACDKLGLSLDIAKTNWKWYGKWMKDYNNTDAAYKNGIHPSRYGKADSGVISVKGNDQAYEVGLYQTDEGIVPVWDNWSGGRGLLDVIGKQGEKLMQAYSKEVVLDQANNLLMQGWNISEQVLENGDLQIIIEA